MAVTVTSLCQPSLPQPPWGQLWTRRDHCTRGQKKRPHLGPWLCVRIKGGDLKIPDAQATSLADEIRLPGKGGLTSVSCKAPQVIPRSAKVNSHDPEGKRSDMDLCHVYRRKVGGGCDDSLLRITV